MPILPVEPLSLAGIGLIAATIGVLVFTDWPRAYTLGASSIVLFALQFLDQALARGPVVGLDSLAMTPTGVLAGEWWTVVTYAFLHGSLFHIFGNLFILLTAGPALEESVGPNWFLGIYAAGALAAAGAGVGLAQTTEIVAAGTKMVGSSGAIFAVLTAFAVRHPREKLPIPFWIIIWLPSMVVLLVFLAMNIGYVFLDTNVAWYGHFAGFLAGLFIASLPVDPAEDAGADRIDVEHLRGLATTDRAEDAFDHLVGLEEGEEDVAAAWLDVIADEADCPVCGQPLERRDLTVACPEGHDLEAAEERWTDGGPAAASD